MKKACLFAAAVWLSTCSFPYAQEKPAQPDFMFWARMTMGQVVSSATEITGYDIPFEGEWLENYEAGLRATRVISPRLIGRLNVGVVVNTSTVTPRGL
ncbi:MAG TPA: hypothetical protein VF335_08390, partial [Chitinivibrionales bacterium]